MRIDVRTAAVIPARWESSRFPGKPLALLCGRPMIVHVIDRVRTAASIDEVIVATDDARIADTVAAHGARAVMTGECASGTDRVAAALRDESGIDLVVNVQGDEPLLSGRNIDVLVDGMRSAPNVPMGTLCRPLPSARAADPNAVKVVRDLRRRALYFSRAAIPYPRNEAVAQPLVRLHLGIYAFRAEALQQFVGWEPSALERAEGLEQLRALEHRMEILVLDAPDDAQGVDTPEDLARVEAQMNIQ
jgi:3-deoxy-manno-octulosonate cytidylyltransferase (CMP-KDO synthetase)